MARGDKNIGDFRNTDSAAVEAIATLSRNWNRWGWMADQLEGQSKALWGLWKVDQTGDELLDQSNSAAIKDTLECYFDAEEVFYDDDEYPEDVLVQVYRYGDHVARYYDDDVYGGIVEPLTTTDAFDAVHDLARSMENYIVLDDSDYSERQWQDQRRAFDDAWESVDHYIEDPDTDFEHNEEIKGKVYDHLQGWNPELGYHEEADRCLAESSDYGRFYVDTADNIMPALEELGYVVSEITGKTSWGKNQITYRLPEPLDPIEQGHLDAIRLGLQPPLSFTTTLFDLV